MEYGTSAYRVMRWKLSPNGREVASRETLERGTTMARNPTTAAILDGKCYFMANTGIEDLKDSKIVDPEMLEPCICSLAAEVITDLLSCYRIVGNSYLGIASGSLVIRKRPPSTISVTAASEPPIPLLLYNFTQ